MKEFHQVIKSFLETLNQIMIPNTIDETLKYPHWKEAMNEEMQALIKNKTWDVVDKPNRKKQVGFKWVYTIKYKLGGSLEMYKGCLVAKENIEDYGIYYKETFALVAKMNTMIILIIRRELILEYFAI